MQVLKFCIDVIGKVKFKVWFHTLLISIVSLSIWSAIHTNKLPFNSAANITKRVSEKCDSGIYKGPYQNKTYFTKDPWLWVVTPEFGKRFCMPSQFIDNDLKGAEAIAFRLLNKTDTENCQLKDAKTFCYATKDLRFEIYQKKNTKLPKLHEHNYFQKSIIPSASLLNASSKEWRYLGEIASQREETALSPHFNMKQVGLHAVDGERILGPSIVLEEITFVSSVFEGLDFYAFEGPSGFFQKPEVQQSKSMRFSILFKPLTKDAFKPLANQSTASMGYSIEMPKVFTDQLAEIDRVSGFKLPQRFSLSRGEVLFTQ
jgi:hypothetical protein